MFIDSVVHSMYLHPQQLNNMINSVYIIEIRSPWTYISQKHMKKLVFHDISNDSTVCTDNCNTCTCE